MPRVNTFIFVHITNWDLFSAHTIGTTAACLTVCIFWEVSVHISGRCGSVRLGHGAALPELALAIVYVHCLERLTMGYFLGY